MAAAVATGVADAAGVAAAAVADAFPRHRRRCSRQKAPVGPGRARRAAQASWLEPAAVEFGSKAVAVGFGQVGRQRPDRRR